MKNEKTNQTKQTFLIVIIVKLRKNIKEIIDVNAENQRAYGTLK